MGRETIQDGEQYMSLCRVADRFNGTNVLFFFMMLTLIWDVRFEVNHLLFFFIFLVLTSVA
ncbi:MAG: hypothetical protein GX024_03700 [Clostridiales bacterium]|jgi:hypothetical protein|nr:hypothetical protein [Clostridiales bacterium]